LNDKICLNDLQPLFISTTTACQPYIENIPLDTIVSIKIKTLKDFDVAHKANDLISDYFNIWASRELVKIEDFINFRYLKSYGYDENYLTINLRLMTPPKNNLEAQFEIQILLSDGRVLRTISDLVSLK
jgi:Na+-transporting NADH:ubiquinone oxidoreductase subunit NqrF